MGIAAVAVLAGGQPAVAGTIWSCTQSNWSSDSHLMSYDTVTQSLADYGAIGGLSLLTDLAVSDAGALYGVGFPNSSGRGQGMLYALTPGGGGATGYSALTVNGSFSGQVNGMAWYGDALYVSSNDSRFYKLTGESDGSWTVAKQGKLKHASSGDLAFAADGTLYAVVRSGNNAKLATIDYDVGSKHFGKDTFVGAKAGYKDVYGLAFSDGVLYGAATSGNFADSTLVTFDLGTGSASCVGKAGVPVWGMASGGGPGHVPEPGTVALMSIGIAGLVLRRRGRRAASKS